MMEQKMLEEKEKLRAANTDRLKIAKGEKLLTAIRENVAAREQIDDEAMTGKSWDDSPPMAKNGDKSPNSIDLQSASSDLDLGGSGGKKGGLKKEEKAIEVRKMARLRARRRKLTQRAKALAKALGDITEDDTRYIGDWSSDVCSSDLLVCANNLFVQTRVKTNTIVK